MPPQDRQAAKPGTAAARRRQAAKPVTAARARRLSLAVRITMAAALLAGLVPSAPLSATGGQSSAGQAFAVTVEEKKAEAQAVADKLNEWLKELEKASDDYYAALDGYNSAIAEKEAATLRVAELQAVIDDNQEALAKRASAMYKSGSMGFLEVLLGSGSFEDFSTRMDFYNRFHRENSELIEQNKAAKHEAELARDAIVELEAQAAQKLDEAAEIRVRVQATVAAYDALLASREAELKELIIQEQEELRRKEEEAQAQELLSMPEYVFEFRGDGNHSFDPEVYGDIVEAAYSRIGSPYIWAAEGPNTFDCSGLTMWCYAQVGIELPHYSEHQRDLARSCLPPREAQPGDILWKQGHVGIYVGDGMFIHAPNRGELVKLQSMEGYPWVYALRY